MLAGTDTAFSAKPDHLFAAEHFLSDDGRVGPVGLLYALGAAVFIMRPSALDVADFGKLTHPTTV